MDGDALEVLDDVAADLLAEDVVGADDVVWGQDAGAVSAEYVGVGGVRGEVERAGAVVGGARPFGELGGVAAVEVGLVWGIGQSWAFGEVEWN